MLLFLLRPVDIFPLTAGLLGVEMPAKPGSAQGPNLAAKTHAYQRLSAKLQQTARKPQRLRKFPLFS